MTTFSALLYLLYRHVTECQLSQPRNRAILRGVMFTAGERARLTPYYLTHMIGTHSTHAIIGNLFSNN